MSLDEALKMLTDHPNRYFILKILERLLALQAPISKMVVVVSLKNGEAGSYLTQRDKDEELSLEAKVKMALQLFSELKIPMSYLKEVKPT